MHICSKPLAFTSAIIIMRAFTRAAGRRSPASAHLPFPVPAHMPLASAHLPLAVPALVPESWARRGRGPGTFLFLAGTSRFVAGTFSFFLAGTCLFLARTFIFLAGNLDPLLPSFLDPRSSYVHTCILSLAIAVNIIFRSIISSILVVANIITTIIIIIIIIIIILSRFGF